MRKFLITDRYTTQTSLGTGIESRTQKELDLAGQWLTREQVEELCDLRADWERQLCASGSTAAKYYEQDYNEALNKIFGEGE